MTLSFTPRVDSDLCRVAAPQPRQVVCSVPGPYVLTGHAPPPPRWLSRDGICAGLASIQSSACPPRTSYAAVLDLGHGSGGKGPGSDSLLGGSCAQCPLESLPSSNSQLGAQHCLPPRVCFGNGLDAARKRSWTAGPDRGQRLKWRRRMPEFSDRKCTSKMALAPLLPPTPAPTHPQVKEEGSGGAERPLGTLVPAPPHCSNQTREDIGNK